MIKPFTLVLLLCSCFAFGQLSNRLEEKMREGGDTYIPVYIEFVSSVSLEALNAEFNREETPLNVRVRLVNRLLMKQAQRSQASAKRLLEDVESSMLKSSTSFYISNIMVLEAKPQLIIALSRLPEVVYMDWAGDDLLPHDPIIAGTTNKTKAINGIEPGLSAINAPAMWALGYTGRGRKVYNYDTGVWATHPAFKDRFLGNFAPLSEAWYGLQYDYPDGRISNHGTHTLGTIAGLDSANKDTIGVAFGAYWMANDYVASTVAALPPLAQMVGAFEWALNPDGDTTTTHDVPDVINNSWRWRDEPDTVHCGGFIVQLMNAIEAAGIANIFSGGNSGPNNTSVNSPQRINTSKMNTFSVGSIDGNQSFPYPISSFSTRGPSQCPASGNLLIHPEVVAPGQNVRSAWGTHSYNTISGTSMAAPHVSGAVLLLKEAFPNLSGAQLMEALYNSAIDMGATDEDNTYGNGLIDVHAAYQLLAQTHTPVNPNAIPWDISVKNILFSAGSEVICGNSINPKIVLENLGDNAISSVSLTYTLNGVSATPTPLNFNTNLNTKGSTDTLLLPAPISLSGNQQYTLSVSVSITQNEYETINNTRVVRFTQRPVVPLPFNDDFEQGILPVSWYVKNEDALTTWDSIQIQGWPGNNTAAYLNFSDYLPRNSQRDALWSPALQLPVTNMLNLSFDLAYQQAGTINFTQDTLQVYASTDCGQSFPHQLYNKAAADLNTTGTVGSNFAPASRADWRRENIDLSAFSGQEILLSFVGINRKGNNLYLDNISIYEGAIDPISLAEKALSAFELYPNPAKETLHIGCNLKVHTPIRIAVYDIRGKTCIPEHTFEANEALDVQQLAPGVYFVLLKHGSTATHLKFIKSTH